jgi:hypothetical protein
MELGELATGVRSKDLFAGRCSFTTDVMDLFMNPSYVQFVSTVLTNPFK